MSNKVVPVHLFFYLFHNPSFPFGEGDMATILVFNVFDLDLASSCSFHWFVIVRVFFTRVSFVRLAFIKIHNEWESEKEIERKTAFHK